MGRACRSRDLDEEDEEKVGREVVLPNRLPMSDTRMPCPRPQDFFSTAVYALLLSSPGMSREMN